MKKKILFISLISLVLIVGLFVLTGCGAKNEGEENNTEEPVDESLVKINELEFHLDKEEEFKGIKYAISEDFIKAEHDISIPYIQYSYRQEDGTNLLFLRIFYYENKDNNYALNDLGKDENVTLVDGKTDNIEYKVYEEPREDGGTIHFYFINKDGSTYAINFVSKYDIKDFENKVLNSIKL